MYTKNKALVKSQIFCEIVYPGKCRLVIGG